VDEVDGVAGRHQRQCMAARAAANVQQARRRRWKEAPQQLLRANELEARDRRETLLLSPALVVRGDVGIEALRIVAHKYPPFHWGPARYGGAPRELTGPIGAASVLRPQAPDALSHCEWLPMQRMTPVGRRSVGVGASERRSRSHSRADAVTEKPPSPPQLCARPCGPSPSPGSLRA